MDLVAEKNKLVDTVSSLQTKIKTLDQEKEVMALEKAMLANPGDFGM